MQDWAPTVIALLGAGGGAILLKLTERVLDALSGRGRKRRDEVDRAYRGRDWEAQKRRIAEEYASRQTRRLIEASCVETASIEPFPIYPPKETS